MAKKKSGLVEDAVEARRIGLTYGKYKALQQGRLEDYKRRFEEEQGEKSDQKG